MKLGVICESPSDQAAIRILVEALLRTPTELVPELVQRTGGFSEVIRTLPGQLTSFHFNSEAEAVVMIVDSDDSPLHQIAHEFPGKAEANCRVCILQQVADRVFSQIGPRPFYPPLKLAIGTPCPAIEAWYLYRLDQHNLEAEWTRKLVNQGKLFTDRKLLKRRFYKTERLSQETSCASRTPPHENVVVCPHGLASRSQRSLVP